MPAISVVVPVYNVEKYLRRCLNSILNQTFTDWEAVFINDGSQDNSLDILKEYANKDSRIKIIDKNNTGMSDARNKGLEVVSGEYVLFVDSDDFIHPQTMEITYYLAQRDKSDVVTFTYDRLYRPQLMVRYKLGLDTDNVIPVRLKQKYDLSKIKTLVTENVFDYATEKTHNMFNPKRKWLVKHCQVWKNLYRKDFIKGITFIKGILFEDFPWWSEVLLRNPKVTLTRLPLYFYFPNFKGTVLSAKQLKIMQGICIGIQQTYDLYKSKATDYQIKQWSSNFLWLFVDRAFRKVKYLDNNTDIEIARKLLLDLEKNGVLDNPPTKQAKKLRCNICKFIKTCK